MTDQQNKVDHKIAHGHEGLWSRLCNTPVSDVLRGNLTCRLDLRKALDEDDLPKSLKVFIFDVTKKTKLWRSEQIDVARELAGHFRDGLESGATPEQLIETFGDVGQSTKMIRRARIRCRPLHWQIRHYTLVAIGLLFGAMFVSYGILALRFFTASPTISRNYFEEINDVAKAIPEEDRAWPFYREAILQYQEPKEEWYDAWSRHPYETSVENSDIWEKLTAHVEKYQPQIQLVHQGARREKLGYVYGDPDNREFLKQNAGRESDALEPDQSLYNLILSHTQNLRSLARLLIADANVAARRGEGDRLADDLRSLIALAEQCRGQECFIEELVSYALVVLGMQLTTDVLAEQPELLSDDQLTDIAHRFSAYAGGGTLRASTKAERRFFDDLLQRSFTDDGTGDGRFTPAGYELFQEMGAGIRILAPAGESFQGSSNKIDLEKLLGGPGMMAMLGSRKENHALACQLMDLGESDFSGPLYSWKESRFHQEMQLCKKSQRERIRYAPVLLMIPALEQVALAGERTTQIRDGVLTAIALELYHRHMGAWPQTLHDLVPRYLPAVPIDRTTGGDLGYVIREGRPLVYSAGSDREDNGGAIPTTEEDHRNASMLNLSALPQAKGIDWIHFPRPRFPATVENQ